MARGATPSATAAAVSHRIAQIERIEMLTRGLSETERSPKEKPRLVLIMGGRMEQQREEAKRRAEIREKSSFAECG